MCSPQKTILARIPLSDFAGTQTTLLLLLNITASLETKTAVPDTGGGDRGKEEDDIYCLQWEMYHFWRDVDQVIAAAAGQPLTSAPRGSLSADLDQLKMHPGELSGRRAELKISNTISYFKTMAIAVCTFYVVIYILNTSSSLFAFSK